VGAVGVKAPRRSAPLPLEAADQQFEDLDELPRPTRRPRHPGDGMPPARRGRRARDAGFGPPDELPVPAGKPPLRLRSVILKALLSIFLLTLCSAGPIAALKLYRAYTFAQSVTNIALPTVNTSANNAPKATPLPTDLTSLDHFNMLLLGSDNDTKFATGAVLTQTDIVVRVDFKNHKITMVSIPRDFYIKSDYGRCCYKLDEISGAETDGASTPQQAKLHGFAHTMATIEADFGIPLSAFAWVGLDGFVNVINTLGGVDVDVLHPIVDDAYPNDVNNADPYSYKRLDIPAGPQHLDGLTALEYVRSRHSDLTGDFGRSARQQSVLLALKKKLEDPSIFTKLDQFANDLQGSVLTSLSLGQVLQLATFAKGLKSSDFQQYVLSAPTYAHDESIPTADGGTKSIVNPDMQAIDNLLATIFTDANLVNLKISAPQSQQVHAENAPIVIENGTNVSGLAAKLQAILKGEGFNVIGVQSAPQNNLPGTQIEYFDPKVQGTAQVLESMFQVPPQLLGTAPPQGAAIVIVIGGQAAINAIQQAG
jgi:LCP family protein required for cell wall assembly